ncbi:MAG: cell division protein ZapA [Bacteroidota bacterium]|nr:cell division protein ZapA [Bacteroidota bacterium]MEE3037839.1 cell division protein ZapA [Bacteroidota bacterium]
MQKLKIKVKIANRVFPLTISRNEEEGIRKAVKAIEDRLKIYESRFEAKDTQDLLSMCLLEMSVNLLGDEQKLKVDSDLEDKLLAMESVIDHHL